MKFLPLLFLFFLTSQVRARALFTDDSLKVLLKESTKGLIYLWSPLMPLSVLGKNDIAELGPELDLKVTILLDPHFPSQETDPLMVSEELLGLGMLNHYPALVLYKNHRLTRWMLQGFENKENLKRLISEQLELK